MESYWTPEDALAGRCGVEDIGEDRPDYVVELTRLDTSPAGIVRAAVETLLRACSQTRDLPSAVKAAAALLRHYAPQPQFPEPQQAQLPAPSWLDPELRYRPPADGLPERREAESLPLPTEPPIAAPARAAAPAAPVLRAVPTPAPAPRFWDGPSRAATGPIREPN